MPALLILTSTAMHLAESISIKHYNTRHRQGGFAFTAMISFFSMLFFLVTDQNGLLFPAELWWYGIAAGVLYCSASFATYLALQIGSYAMTMLILSYSIVFSIGYGLIFLKETATLFTYAGLLLVLISLYLLRAAKKEEKEKAKFSIKWLICITIAAVGNGMFGVVQRMQQLRFENTVNHEFMIMALAFSTVTLLTVGIWRSRTDCVYVLRHGLLWTASAGFSNGATNAMVVLLHTLMPISISSPIRVAVKVVASFLLSVFLYREKFQKRQIVGALLGVLALIFLNIK